MLENIREAFEGIRTHKLRSILTMLGIIIGIASIIAISSTIMGTNERIKENLIGTANNTVAVKLYQGEYAWSADYNRVPDYLSVADESVLDEVRAVKNVTGAAFFLTRNAYGSVWHGADSLSGGEVTGAGPSYFTVCGYKLRRGRGLTESDFTSFRKVALIDRQASRALFKGEDPVGKTIEIKSEPFTVVGEFETAQNTSADIRSIEDYVNYSDISGGRVLVPVTVWPVIYGYDEPYSMIVSVTDTDAMTDVGMRAAEILNTAAVTGTDTDIRYKAEDVLEQARQLQELSGNTNRQLILIAGISLLVGGIGVMNIMLVSVTERTPEIGLKKALGAGKRRISGQFLVEAGVLTCSGGILGILAGIALAYVIYRVSAVPIFISWWIVAATVVFSFLIGMVFGVVPAVKAAALDPIEALRHE